MFIDMMIRGFNSGVGGDGILFLSNCLFATCTLKQNAFHGFALIGSVSVIYCESYYVLLFAMAERKMFLQVLDELPFSSSSQSEY